MSFNLRILQVYNPHPSFLCTTDYDLKVKAVHRTMHYKRIYTIPFVTKSLIQLSVFTDLGIIETFLSANLPGRNKQQQKQS